MLADTTGYTDEYIYFENVPEEISSLAEGQQLDIAKDLKPSLVYYDENDKQETVQDCKIVLDGYDEEGGWSCEDEEAELPCSDQKQPEILHGSGWLPG